MEIDVTDFVQRVLPWKLRLKIDGKWWDVKAPTVADMDRLTKMMKTAKESSDAESASAFSTLFDSPGPDFSQLTISELTVVSMAIINAVSKMTSKKNAENLALEMAKLETDSTSGSSSCSSPESSPASTT